MKSELKLGSIVEDRWYPLWGTGCIVQVLKTRYKISYPGAPVSMKDKDGNVTYDIAHANMFLNKVNVDETSDLCDPVEDWNLFFNKSTVEKMCIKIKLNLKTK